jgi:hypothetical protein
VGLNTTVDRLALAVLTVMPAWYDYELSDPLDQEIEEIFDRVVARMVAIGVNPKEAENLVEVLAGHCYVTKADIDAEGIAIMPSQRRDNTLTEPILALVDTWVREINEYDRLHPRVRRT